MSAPVPPDTRDRRGGVAAVVLMVAVMWVLEILDTGLSGRLDQLGVVPRETEGLRGIALAPFLHVGFGHLLANTVPFLGMGVLIALSGLTRVLLVTLVVTLVSGLGVWLLASSGTVHLGASGLVFGFATYLIARGLRDRRVLYVGAAVLVAVVWGTALLGGLLPQRGISWEGHLFGALGGVLAAQLLHRGRA